MAYYALFYEVVEDFVRRRAPYREEHLRLVRAAESRGELILAGALADPADRALLVFRAEDRHIPEHFAQNDPYVVNGLVVQWQVRPWAVVQNEPSSPREAMARLWSARATASQSRAYLEHFSHNVLPNLRNLSGYAGAVVLTRRTSREQVEILVATAWRSLAAIRDFAGDDAEAAVVADEAAALLTDFDRRVRHYELALSDIPEAGVHYPV